MTETRVFFLDKELEQEIVEPGRVERKIRAHGGKLMGVEVSFIAGAFGAEHRHEHEQICYCLCGEFVFSVEENSSTIKAGDSVYIPAAALHGAKCIADGRLFDIFTPQREDFL